MTVLRDLKAPVGVNQQSYDDILAMVELLREENAKLKATKANGVGMKIGTKGALSVYGLGRFPVTLYRSQWEKLIAKVPEIQEFIKANSDKLAVKD
jgi:hypothetical protein